MPCDDVGFRPLARHHELVQAQCVMDPPTVAQIPDCLGVVEPRFDGLDLVDSQRYQPHLTHRETVYRKLIWHRAGHMTCVIWRAGTTRTPVVSWVCPPATWVWASG